MQEKQKIKLWASSHMPMPEQGQDFVFLKDINSKLQEQLNNTPADTHILKELANQLLKLADVYNADIYQPAGSPAFQFVLGVESLKYNVSIYYAHSVRESRDEILQDGCVKKISVFRHLGWIKV